MFMKKILIVLIILAVVLFGTWPLGILSEIFRYLSLAFKWLAKALNIFGWNGLY